ncbi:hypothetical protein X747_15085 [Mesorhizobium sp. LNJC384A00]|nr:hypothetical protein X747_15085 [Mesorhizobium sp. LNJC384A00]
MLLVFLGLLALAWYKAASGPRSSGLDRQTCDEAFDRVAAGDLGDAKELYRATIAQCIKTGLLDP